MDMPSEEEGYIQPFEIQSQYIPEEPLHTRLKSVHPQDASPLLNGYIPPEIRNQIFFYALLPYAGTPYPKDASYVRPGYTSPNPITTALLRTCRQAYLETYHFPPITKEHVFWHCSSRGPPGRIVPDSRAFANEEELFYARMTPWQLKLVREIHLFTQLYWLEQSFETLCEEPLMHNMTKVKLTIARGDWWYNERNEPLRIGEGHAALQRSFLNMTSLMELEIEFESTSDKMDELKAIVEDAKKWKLPLRSDMVLSAEGNKVKETRWEGNMKYWSNRCPFCGGQTSCRLRPSGGIDTRCAERIHLKSVKLGPVLYIFTVRWKAIQKPEGNHPLEG